MADSTSIIWFPLGRACRTSIRLQNLGRRSFALPFDWALTPISAADRLVRTRFDGWPDPQRLVCCEAVKRILVVDPLDTNCLTSNDPSHLASAEIHEQVLVRPIFCLENSILFPHEPWIADDREACHRFVVKYARRVLRAKELLQMAAESLIGIRDDTLPVNDFQSDIYRQIVGPNAFAQLFEQAPTALSEACTGSFRQIIGFEELAA